MLSYCLKCRQNAESKNPKVEKIKNRRIMLSLNCAIYESKKSRFIKEQETSVLLSSFGIKTPLSQGPILGPIKMNELINKFLLAGDKFMPEMHLKQPGFT